MADFSMNGVGGVECVTMPLDTATMAAIGTDYRSAIGKAVTLTANDTAGFGAAAGVFFGIIRHVEKDGYATIQVKGYAENVPIKTASAPVLNGLVAVDGTGKLQAAATTAGTVSRGYCTSVDSGAGVATILM